MEDFFSAEVMGKCRPQALSVFNIVHQHVIYCSLWLQNYRKLVGVRALTNSAHTYVLGALAVSSYAVIKMADVIQGNKKIDKSGT